MFSTTIFVAVCLTTTSVVAQFGQDPRYQDQQYNQYSNNNNNQQQDDGCCEEYCFMTDEEPYINFGTKTDYESASKKTNQQHNVPDCNPIQFWSLIRHGTRLPNANKITNLRKLTKLHEEIRKNYEEKRSYPGRGKLCQDDYNLFRTWHWNDSVTEEKSASLTSQGIEEMKLLARRYKSKFSQLFLEPYTERAYKFQYASSDRTHDSYQAFIEAFFGQDAFKVHANIYPNDKLLQPIQSCRSGNNYNAYNTNQNNYNNNNPNNYNTQYTDNSNFDYPEQRKFQQKPEYVQMTRDALRRLGFRFTLNASVINDMYDMCRYEKAWYIQKRSPWCVAFTKQQLKLIEYAEDLKYYYRSGYGNEDNKKIGCPIVKDLFDTFDRTVNGNSDGNKGTFYFANSNALQTTLTALGFFQDSMPLNGDNYYQQQSRNWRTSSISPFAANLAAVLYECRSGERNRVMFFLNENPIEIPDCSVGLCSWNYVKNRYEAIANRCNVNDVCNENSSNHIEINHFIYLIALIGVFMFTG